MSANAAPLVSFVVPCYKHGHFLADCVNSILQQTFGNFEIVIMDDCSPDSTPAVAQSFDDPRIIYVRNPHNLGHLANYNKGIATTRGKYVWLINVDDYLRRPYVLERFVDLMERNPRASFVFCPAVSVHGDVEEPPHGVNGDTDRIFSGTQFLERLLLANCIPTPAVMVRRTSYDRVGLFPLDLPYAGDWFQWCHHALYGEVGYLAEPMVCYRIHDANMTKEFLARPAALIADEVAVRWRILRIAERAGAAAVVEAALQGTTADYSRRVTVPLTGRRWTQGITLRQFEESLHQHCADGRVRARITAAVLGAMADVYYAQGEIEQSREHYRQALRQQPMNAALWAKLVLLGMGAMGRLLRDSLARVRSWPSQQPGRAI